MTTGLPEPDVLRVSAKRLLVDGVDLLGKLAELEDRLASVEKARHGG
jgi:hypothetical protein